ncbi:MAG TPA: hypothetical protein PLP04_06455 [Bryobacteraceae bacterium]|nr:hypothetical protein [Bryobacteraceae bacterium]
MNETSRSEQLVPKGEPLTLPEPVFPLHPEKCGDVPPDPQKLPPQWQSV